MAGADVDGGNKALARSRSSDWLVEPSSRSPSSSSVDLDGDESCDTFVV